MMGEGPAEWWPGPLQGPHPSSPPSRHWVGASPQLLPGSRMHWSCKPLSDPRWHQIQGFWLPPPPTTHTPRTQAPGYPWTACVGGGCHSTKDGPPSRSCCSPGTWTYIVLRPAAFMWGELTLACCLLPPISPIKNILPSRSARSSPGPQLYFINTFRQVQKRMIHAGPEHS